MLGRPSTCARSSLLPRPAVLPIGAPSELTDLSPELMHQPPADKREPLGVVQLEAR